MDSAGEGEVMSRLMFVLGTILALLGLALAVLSVVKPGIMQVYGMTPEVAAILFIGGILALGLGGVISAVNDSAVGPVMMAESTVAMPAKIVETKIVQPVPQETKSQVPSGFGRKGVEAAAAAATATVAAAALAEGAAPAKPAVPSVAETISALEQAKSDIKTALGGMDSVTHPSEELAPVPGAAAHDETEADATDEVAGEGDLYVVEEKIIRGRPARVLSDDTVEAETDEGWMRFENLEHLNEYLDSVDDVPV